jgi:hypothetical protein
MPARFRAEVTGENLRREAGESPAWRAVNSYPLNSLKPRLMHSRATVIIASSRQFASSRLRRSPDSQRNQTALPFHSLSPKTLPTLPVDSVRYRTYPCPISDIIFGF